MVRKFDRQIGKTRNYEIAVDSRTGLIDRRAPKPIKFKEGGKRKGYRGRRYGDRSRL